MITIYCGSDHGGRSRKDEFVAVLKQKGYDIRDMGTNTDESVDYPVYAGLVADAVVRNPGSYGVLFCTSGNGVTIAANKKKGIRAILLTDADRTRYGRAHTNANVLCIGAGYTSLEQIMECFYIFVKTPFEKGRHEKRVNLLELESAKERIDIFTKFFAITAFISLCFGVCAYFFAANESERMFCIFALLLMACLYGTIGTVAYFLNTFDWGPKTPKSVIEKM